MASFFATLGLLSQMAVRNLFASRWKTLIVGGIIFFGALLVTVGNSFLDSITDSMSRSIIGSVAGHIQVYSSKSKDKLELYGGFQESDLANIDDFAAVKRTVSGVPNVKTVVPMGVAGALVTSGNTVDVVLEKLRDAVRKQKEGDASPEARARIETEKAHARQIVGVLEQDMKNLDVISDGTTVSKDDREAAARASAPAFWDGFDADPLGSLEFLENRIAPLAADADLLYLRYVGTDPSLFRQTFDRLRIVEGGPIPDGKRGFMFAKFVYEDQIKLKIARRLDVMKEAIEVKRQTIATDETLQRMVKENTQQVKEILLQLDVAKSQVARGKLAGLLGVAVNADLGPSLAQFLKMDDGNFGTRYAFFYKEIAPLLDLYRVRIGDTLTIKAFTKTGYVQSVSLPVYGTFEFAGLEKSALAGTMNLMDLVSFRDLYGFLTGDKKAEMDKLKAASGIKEVSREHAEAELFGAGREVVAEATPGLAIPDVGGADSGAQGGGGRGERLRREDLARRVYPSEELGKGAVLNAAIILQDPSKLHETMKAIEAAVERDKLPLKVVSWQDAAGLIGQLVTLFRLVLVIAILIIFLVALVIINNALVMATIQRVQEIGTLRAVGAQRRFITGMLLVEAIAIGALFGAAGAGAGAGIVALVGKIGIPATTDVMFFFFSGPRLHPFLGTSSLVSAFAIVLVVSAFSSFYPAWIAMRVTPRQAMNTEE